MTRRRAGVAFQARRQVPVLPDADKRVSRQYDLNAMPSTVLDCDRDGRVRLPHRGLPERLREHLRQADPELLKE
jgi:hypothetical protein